MGESFNPNVRFVELEDAVGLPSTYFVELIEKQNDWTLVIQCHAIIETAVNSALLKAIEPAAAGEWATANWQSFRHRLELCRSMGLIDDTLFQAISALSGLRDSIVHTADGLSFTCMNEIDSGDAKCHDRLYGILRRPNGQERQLSRAHDPMLLRFAIWGVAATTVSKLAPNIKPGAFTVFGNPESGEPPVEALLATAPSRGPVAMMPESSAFQVEQVFLVDRTSGLLLQNAMVTAASVTDADQAAGMLTAIRDYVSRSFAVTENESFRALRVGDLEVLIEQGPHAFIAAVVRGLPGPAVRTALADANEEIHINFGSELQDFDGDTSPFEQVRVVLERCLINQ